MINIRQQNVLQSTTKQINTIRIRSTIYLYMTVINEPRAQSNPRQHMHTKTRYLWLSSGDKRWSGALTSDILVMKKDVVLVFI